MRIQPLLVLFALALVLAPMTAADAKDDDRIAFVLDAVKDLEMGEALRGDLVTLIPLIVPADPKPLGIAGQANAGLEFSEPDLPSHKYAVNVKNPGDKPALLLGGSVVLGGTRDRLIRYDTVIPAGGEAELYAWPASANSEIRKEAAPFELGHSLAPTYIRRKANHGGNYNLVPTFISRNLEFRNEGDDAKSLEAIGRSDIINQFTEEARTKLDEKISSTPQRGSVVGAIVAIRGRLQTLMVFGDRPIIGDNKGIFLKGLTYTAAVIAIQSEKKNVPVPGKDDPDKTFEIVKKDAEKLLKNLKKAKVKFDKTYPDGAVGNRAILQLASGTRGRAVGVDGRLVHLEVFPHDPYSSALWGSTVHLPDEDVMEDPDRMGLVEMGRWANQGGRRLTYAEKRDLERLAPRGGRGGARGGGARGGGGMGGGGRRR